MTEDETIEEMVRAYTKSVRMPGNNPYDAMRAAYAIARKRLLEEMRDGTPSERFARWLEEGPKLAKAAGCHVGIKVTGYVATTGKGK